MKENATVIAEEIQKLAARLLAINPAGHKLCLIGGFRYRLLNASCRASLDIDYHWAGDLARKQADIVALLRKKLLPEVKTRFDYDGNIQPATGPDVDSPAVRVVDMAFYRLGPAGATALAGHRIEVPVEITRIQCSDPPIVCTVGGTVFLTASDADMIESKVIALFNRLHLQARDIVDIFLFQGAFASDSAKRLAAKFAKASLSPKVLGELMNNLAANRNQHVRALDRIIGEQLDDTQAANIKLAGGGTMIFNVVMGILQDKLGIKGGP